MDRLTRLENLHLRVRLGARLSQQEAEDLIRAAYYAPEPKPAPRPTPRKYTLLHVTVAALLAATLVRACDPAPAAASFGGVDLVVAELKNLVAATKEQTRTLRELGRGK